MRDPLTIAARLGAKQVEVLRAAAQSTMLRRYDDGGWSDRSPGHGACTRPARPLAALGLFVDGQRMADVTMGSWRSRQGVYVGLSPLGEQVWAAWQETHPAEVQRYERHREAIRAIVAKPGPVQLEDVLKLAADDPNVSDDTFVVLRQAMEGRPIDL